MYALLDKFPSYLIKGYLYTVFGGIVIVFCTIFFTNRESEGV